MINDQQLKVIVRSPGYTMSFKEVDRGMNGQRKRKKVVQVQTRPSLIRKGMR